LIGGNFRSANPRGNATMPNTVRLHRVLATTPEKVYRAFLEADALAKWLPPNGFACTVSHLEPKVGDIQVTVMLKNVSVGTEVNIVQEGLPDVIPPEACYLGWQESLRNLARLVEPEINQ
jgi:uncharacterized protein YndB with AHSA1/START domain